MTLPFSHPVADLAGERRLPTMFDLPHEDPSEPGLPDEFHDLQPQLLSATLRLNQYSQDEIFSVSDMNLYYDPDHTGWYKRPDWLLVVGVDRLYAGEWLRSSYVVWDEKVPPALVVEFLSPGTEAEDLGRFAAKPPRRSATPSKFEVYEEILKIPNYIVYDEATEQIRYFRLINGCYQEQPVAATNPKIWLPDLAIGLGIWTGSFQNAPRQKLRWLRWCDREGQWLLTEAEAELEAERRAKETERRAKETERRAKEAERAAKEAAQQQVRQGIQTFLNMGLSVPQVAEAMGMTEAEVQALVRSPR
jgi:Uma2 family endonuclease